LSSEIRKFLSQSYLFIVIAGFGVLAALNGLTYFLNSDLSNSFSRSTWLYQIAVNYKFDSLGTLAGLLGSVLLFVPVLLGTPAYRRKSTSIFLFVASILVGTGSSLIWDRFYGGGTLSYGASAIDIAAQSIIFTLACYALISSFFRNPVGAKRDSYVRNAFRIIYATLIATTLWYILFLQPIFVSTALYNWRVHEIAFLSGVAVTGIYMAIYISAIESKRNSPEKLESQLPGKLDRKQSSANFSKCL
jgi:hypothetical protein